MENTLENEEVKNEAAAGDEKSQDGRKGERRRR